MNLLEALTHLVDAARQTPENRYLVTALRVVEKKIARLREQKEWRTRKQAQHESWKAKL